MTTFRLASVLRLRRTLREQAESRAASAHRASIAADLHAVTRRDELGASALEQGTAGTFLASVTAMERRAASVRAADATAEGARLAHRRCIDELVQASMDVSALERLEHRAVEAATAEERKKEGREIDDLVTARFSQRATAREVQP
jgi:flagellar biosynthesis chaperone FliJ